MPKLPIAPDVAQLQALTPELTVLAADTLLFRIYKRGGAHPTLWNELRYYGPNGGRFDHQCRDSSGAPMVQDRGISYFATDINTALAEVFQVDRTVDRVNNTPWLVGFKLNNALELLDLRGTFALKAGASMKLMSGPRAHSQNWSRGFYDAYPNCDGICYPSSLTNRATIALFERALTKSPFPRAPSVHRALNDPLVLQVLNHAASDLGYALV